MPWTPFIFHQPPLLLCADGNVYLPDGGLERFVFISPCDCVDCEFGFYNRSEQVQQFPFLTYRSSTSSGPGKLSDSEVQRLAHNFVTQTAADRAFVQQRLNAHGDIIMSRWKKKKGKRQTILKEVEPRRPVVYTHLRLYTREELGRTKNANEALADLVTVAERGSAHGQRNESPCVTQIPYPSLTPGMGSTRFSANQASLEHGHLDVQFSAKCVIMHGSQYGRIVG